MELISIAKYVFRHQYEIKQEYLFWKRFEKRVQFMMFNENELKN